MIADQKQEATGESINPETRRGWGGGDVAQTDLLSAESREAADPLLALLLSQHLVVVVVVKKKKKILVSSWVLLPLDTRPEAAAR